MKLNGKIIITRPTSASREGEYFNIAISDKLSGVQFLEVEISAVDFACALTASYRDCVFELRHPETVGMTAQGKTDVVPFERPWGLRGVDLEAAITAALAPFEVDGWEARRSDMTNQHRRSGEKGQRVHFSRHVPTVTQLDPPRTNHETFAALINVENP